MEKFSLDKWLKNKSRKVVTRDGREVEIVKYDTRGTHFPVLYVISDEDGSQNLCECSKSGMCQFDNTQSSTDLFFADEEEELTEFEQELRYWIGQSLCNYEYNGCVSDNMSDSVNIYLKAASKKLLDLARKELQPEFDKEMDKMLAETDKVVYQKGHEDALKDLPKWKKIIRPEQKYLAYGFLSWDNYYLIIQELKDKLPKEE